MDETPGSDDDLEHRFACFSDGSRICIGALADVALAAKAAQNLTPQTVVLIFDRETAAVVDLDLRGSDPEVRARYAEPDTPPGRRGRPKLGVVPREVTLLPRHWDWLSRQPGGASAALRRLVETARKSDQQTTEKRARKAAAYSFMATMAGNLRDFEDAARALFAGEDHRLSIHMSSWPPDIADETLRILKGAGLR